MQFFDICTSKSAPTPSIFCILTSRRASRHRGVQFFDIASTKNASDLTFFCTVSLQNALLSTAACSFSTSQEKNASDLTFFVHFDKMRFSPQGRAIFRHRKYKKCFGPDVFCTVSLQNALLSTAACSFSTSQEKNASDLTFFVRFDFKMRFSPQGRAIFDFSAEQLPPHPPL